VLVQLPRAISLWHLASTAVVIGFNVKPEPSDSDLC